MCCSLWWVYFCVRFYVFLRIYQIMQLWIPACLIEKWNEIRQIRIMFAQFESISSWPTQTSSFFLERTAATGDCSRAINKDSREVISTTDTMIIRANCGGGGGAEKKNLFADGFWHYGYTLDDDVIRLCQQINSHRAAKNTSKFPSQTRTQALFLAVEKQFKINSRLFSFFSGPLIALPSTISSHRVLSVDCCNLN